MKSTYTRARATPPRAMQIAVDRFSSKGMKIPRQKYAQRVVPGGPIGRPCATKKAKQSIVNMKYVFTKIDYGYESGIIYHPSMRAIWFARQRRRARYVLAQVSVFIRSLYRS